MKTTPILTLPDVLQLIEEAKNAEICRDLETLREILQRVWSDVEQPPDFSWCDEIIRAELLRLAGAFLSFYGNARSLKNYQIRGKDLLTEAIGIFEANKLSDKSAEAKVMLAFCYWNAGEINEAEAILHLVEIEFGENPWHPVYLQIRINRLLTLFWKQETEAALKIIEELKKPLEFCADARLAAMFHNQAGIFYRSVKEYEKCAFHLNEAIRFAKMANNLLFVAINYNNLAFLYKETGNYERAYQCISESIGQFTQINHQGFLAHALDTKALIYLDWNKRREALETINLAVNRFYQGEDYNGLTAALWTKVKILFTLNNPEDALVVFGELASVAAERIGEVAVRKFAKNLSEEIYALRGLPLAEEVAEFKKERISAALLEAKGVIGTAARRLRLKNHQALSDILNNQFPELYKELGFRRRKQRTKVKAKREVQRVVSLHQNDIHHESEISRLVMPDKNYSFNFHFSSEKFETFYFDKFLMRSFGIETGAIVAVVPLGELKKGMTVLVSTDEILSVGKVEYDDFANIFFISDDVGFPVPLDDQNVIGEPVGYCLFERANAQFIEFSRLGK